MTNLHSNLERNQMEPVKLTLEQYQVTELLAIGKTSSEVAQLVGVEATIVEQWQQNPKFAAALNMLRIASSAPSGNTEETKTKEPITTLVDVARFL